MKAEDMKQVWAVPTQHEFCCTTLSTKYSQQTMCDEEHAIFYRTWSPAVCSDFSIAFFASSYPAKFIAPRGAIQKNLGTAPLKRPSGPSRRRMEKATMCIETGSPRDAVISLVFITSKGVVTTAARPPERAPTAIVSQGSNSRLRRLWAA